jgi:hypothetical protein
MWFIYLKIAVNKGGSKKFFVSKGNREMGKKILDFRLDFTKQSKIQNPK